MLSNKIQIRLGVIFIIRWWYKLDFRVNQITIIWVPEPCLVLWWSYPAPRVSVKLRNTINSLNLEENCLIWYSSTYLKFSERGTITEEPKVVLCVSFLLWELFFYKRKLQFWCSQVINEKRLKRLEINTVCKNEGVNKRKRFQRNFYQKFMNDVNEIG